MQPTDEKFSDINVRSSPKPSVQVVNNSSDRIRFNKNCFVLAIIRALLIVFQFGGWVAAASIPKAYYGVHYLPVEFDSTRSAYLFFSITGFIIAIIFLVLMILNIVNWKIFSRIPWILLLLVTDALWIIPTLVLAIVCVVRESAVHHAWGLNVVINQGAFGAAAAFGFLCTLLYIVGALLETLAILRDGIDAKIPSA